MLILNFFKKYKKIAFKPLLEMDISIPETFENIRYADAADLEIQKTPGVWLTRTGGAVSYNKEKQALEVGNYYWRDAFPLLFRGSCEVTIPKGYLENRKGVEILFCGHGWFSIKLMESTITPGGVRTYAEGDWRKLDTVREKEILVWSDTFRTRKIYFQEFYNKPFNVDIKAYIRGFRPLEKSNIASVEITGRWGKVEVLRLSFFD